MQRFAFLLTVAALGTGAATRTALGAPSFKNNLSGVVVSINGTALVLKKRNGKLVNVDMSEATADSRVGVLAPGVPVVMHGTRNADGSFHCLFTSHAGPKLTDWASDQ